MSYSVEYIENEDDPYKQSVTIKIDDDAGVREYVYAEVFSRNLDWILTELRKAYDQGNRDGQNEWTDCTITKYTKGWFL